MTLLASKLRVSTLKTFFLIIVLSICVIPSLSFVQKGDKYAEEIKMIEDYVEKELERLKIPSISIAFYKDDFFWKRSFGYADMEHKIPARPDTLYRLASISKPITAVGILRLMEEGKLSLDDEVQKYVPYFPRKRWPITIRHLLGHLSGISHYRNYDEEGHFKTHYTTEESIGVFKDWKLKAKPGTKFIYTTYGFNLLGGVIEGASGKPYAEYMRQNVWKPLGMNNTTMDIANDIITNRASGYRRINGEVKNCEFVDISSRFAGGGIRSTVVDLVNLSKGLDEGKVLSKETQKMMYTSMVTKNGRATEYGMGWGVDFIQGFWNVAHGGGQQGTSTHLLRFPGEKFAVAVTCNEENQNTSRYARLVSGLILGAFPYRLETPSLDSHWRLRLTFLAGLGYYSKFGTTFAADDEDLKESFVYFNKLDPDAKRFRQQINDGAELLTGAPLVKVGTCMAEKIKEHHGKSMVDELRRNGSIPFFKTYIDLYKKDSSIPDEYKFPGDFERMLEDWHRSYVKTWTEETKKYFLIPIADLGKYIDAIKDKFKGEIVYPRLNSLFNSYAYYLKGKKKLDEGLAVLLDAIELFPSDANLFDSVGEFYLVKGDKTKAIEYYKKALEANPNLRSSIQALEKLEEKHSLDYLIKHTRVKSKK
ncbi:MAG: serine hydrolase [Candidatus Aminicenantes bacterium]|nr:MAG: serine hydrolase [Candidatus Aminicenantes bacterium]